MRKAITLPTAVLQLCAAIVTAFALAVDVASAHPCPGDPNSQCRGPEVGKFLYAVGHHFWSSGRSQAEAIAGYRQQALAAGFCTLNVTDQLPARLPDPNIGNGQVGDYAAAYYYAQGTYYAWESMLNTERHSTIIPLLVEGTKGWSCERQHGPHGAYVQRSREVRCPAGWLQDNNKGACYRWNIARDPRKNFGAQCTIANPVNGATGNKFQQEIDYQSPVGPLNFIRYYNSFASSYGDTAAASNLGPNWRSNYDASVRFGASATYPTAYAYRPDGRTFAFDLVNGAFKSDADVHASLAAIRNAAQEIIGWTFVDHDSGNTETYDEYGQIVGLTTRSELNLTIVRDAKGRVSTVTDSFGNRLEFSYDANGRLQSMTVPGGEVHQYGYDANGNSSSVAFPGSGGVKTYLYNEPAHTGGRNFPRALTGILDESSSRFATFQYDGNYRVAVSEHAGGADRHEFTYEQTANPSTVWVKDPLQQQRQYTFTNILGVARGTGVSQPCSSGCSASANTTYDTSANVTSRTDFKGNKTCYAYDALRSLETVRVEGFAPGSICPANLAAYVPAVGTRERKITTQWHPTYRLPAQIEEAARRTSYSHDPNGNVLTKTVIDLTATPNVSRAWTYTYNSFGRVLTADGPRTDVADVTTYTYYNCNTGYQCGQVHTITNALGHVTTYNTYNAHGQPLTITDPNGVVTTLTYDLRQRLTSRTVGLEQTSFEYWPTGLLKKATLSDGSYLEYTYDAAHRLTDINDADGNRIHYTLDAMGNRTNEEVFDSSQALSRTRTQVFNTLNQLWKQIGAAGGASVTTEFGYDNNGNQTTINAPLARNTTQSYDELNRLKTITDPASGLTTYGYDALDQLIAVTDPKGRTTTYTYNALGDLMQQVSPDTGTTANTYDSGGNLKTSTDARSKTATYDYDALNRVTSVAYADQTIGYTYDTGTNQNGRLTQITDTTGSTGFSYDAQGRVLTRQQTTGTISKNLGYSYDSVGRLQALTLPSGNSISYGYANGQVVSLTLNGTTTLLWNVLYQPFGPVTGWRWGNDTIAVREYDQDGKITLADSAGLKTYSYDDAFRITAITDAHDPTLSQSYGYDLLDRLTSATGTHLNQSWTYDPNGNRLTQAGSQASTYSVSPTSNRLNSIAGALTKSYDYDAAGNTTNDGSATYTYNDAGRMISATQAGVTSTFALNGLGQRVRKTTSGTSTYFVYDEAGHLVGEYNDSGTLIAETIWFGDIPVAVLKPNGSGGVNVFYVHTDHLNTPRRITRPSDNAIVWRWDSDPFGTTAANENPSGLGVFTYNLRFPGQYYDAETSLHYNYFRDYDPQTGRYIQSDPSGLEGGLNTYVYAASSPLLYIDPEGKMPTTTCMRLRLLVWLSCKGYAKRCSAADTCPELMAKHQLALQCIELQAMHTAQCFGDRPTHQQVISDALNRARNCITLYLSRGCTTCGVPP